MKITLTNPLQEPWTHQEFTETDENGVVVGYKEFHKGDVVDVTPDTADHLTRTGQAEVVEE